MCFICIHEGMSTLEFITEYDRSSGMGGPISQCSWILFCKCVIDTNDRILLVLLLRHLLGRQASEGTIWRSCEFEGLCWFLLSLLFCKSTNV